MGAEGQLLVPEEGIRTKANTEEQQEHEHDTKHTAIYPTSGLTEGDNTPTAASMVYMISISHELQC